MIFALCGDVCSESRERFAMWVPRAADVPAPPGEAGGGLGGAGGGFGVHWALRAEGAAALSTLLTRLQAAQKH